MKILIYLAILLCSGPCFVRAPGSSPPVIKASELSVATRSDQVPQTGQQIRAATTTSPTTTSTSSSTSTISPITTPTSNVLARQKRLPTTNNAKENLKSAKIDQVGSNDRDNKLIDNLDKLGAIIDANENESQTNQTSLSSAPSSNNDNKVQSSHQDVDSKQTNQHQKQTNLSAGLVDAGARISSSPSGPVTPTNAATTTTSFTSKLSGHLRFEFQRYDGWYNNLANSEWGTSNSRLRRKVAPAYSDGVYQMSEEGRPSARVLSQKMMRGEDGLGSKRNLTTLFAFFGQLISSEILMASELGCPIEMHRIKIDKCDPMYDRDCKGGRTMPFYRAAYDQTTGQSPNLPREQLNRVTSWIDGSFIYSTSETWLNTMRSFDGRGTLKMTMTPEQAVKQTTSESPPSKLKPQTTPATNPTVFDPKIQAANFQKDPSLMMNHLKQMVDNAPMSLFGYPIRNKQRAPLQNHMPAHHLKVKNAERMFLLGDPRTNQNPIILALGILFYRWHNVLAERIYAQHPDWSDEEIFQRARRLVIASLQNIILYEFLPVLLDTPPPYGPHNMPKHPKQEVAIPQANRNINNNSSNNVINDLLVDYPVDGGPIMMLPDNKYDQLDLIRPYFGYKPDLHPGVSHVFQSAAFRFGHTLIPPGLYLRDHKCKFMETANGFKGIRLCSTWWNAEEVISQVGIEQLLMGASSQIAEREDYVLCNDVRDKLFGTLDFNRRDLAALNIMRGRDNGIADYNTVRQAFKLPKISAWRDINPALYARHPEIFEELARLYENQIDRIDLYVGGMLESDIEQGKPGPLFRRIIKEQFERLRDADRFWFENQESGIFSASEIEQIKQISLYDIIINSTLIPEDSIQKQVFQFSSSDPCPQPGQLSSQQLQPCYAVKGQSYFKGNELPYALVCITLILIPIVCHLVATYLVNHQERLRRHFKTKQEYQRNMRASPRPQTNSSKPSGTRNHRTSPDQNQTCQNGSGKRLPTDGDKADKFYTKEWLHNDLKRKIKIRFGPAPDEALYVLDRRCQVQRRLDLAQTKTIVVELSADMGSQPTSQIISPNPLQSASRNSLESICSSYSTVNESRRGSQLTLVPNHNNNSNGLNCDKENIPPQRFNSVELDQPTKHKPMILIRVERNYDLVLQFCDVQQRRRFLFRLQAYLTSINKCMVTFRVSRDIMLVNAETKERRQQRLDQFFREAYALTFGLSSSSASNNLQNNQSSNSNKVSDVGFVMRTSLSRQEFAEALGMRSDCLFVKQMFNCIDKDGNGRISFQEFLDTVVMFSRGKPDDKLRIIFDMCVTDSRGLIEKDDLVRVLRSLVDMAKTNALSEVEVMQMIDEMFKTVGLQDKQLLSYEDFKLIINSQQQKSTSNDDSNEASQKSGIMSRLFEDGNIQQKQTRILAIGLDMKGANRNFLVDTSVACAAQAKELERQQLFDVGLDKLPNSPDSSLDRSNSPSASSSSSSSIQSNTDSAKHLKYNNTIRSKEKSKKNKQSQQAWFWNRWARNVDERWRAYITELEQHGKDIVYMLSFFVIVGVLFMERFIQYSFLSEHMDLRHVMGFGIAITRGSAASLSFCYAMLLLTMCRNLMTRLRTTSLSEYLPLDSHVKFHKVIAMTALVMTVLHSVGHCVNFFHVTQQPVEHLRCLTKEMQFSVEARPTFTYWVFQTVTGSTGIMLWVLCSILYVFTQARVRQKAYKYFWSTHKLYYLIYALTLLHGSSKLTGNPKFWIFFIIPAILFAIDKVISLQTKLLELEIFETECLPSDVISLKFARPPSFRFLSGQWVRIACTAFRPHEFHAFTLTSAPQDDFLSVHVRAQGPWTWKLRSLFDPANLQYNQLLNSTIPPRIRIDGPFGGGNQDWYKYEVAVMICGGIGVTPYASILNDLVFNTSTNRYSGVSYKKIYFIWICPSHRNFEWFIDVLRDVEAKDTTNLLEMHIFITQFFHKFDLRTTMLYICENHFQRISNRSLFTGLRAVNHFGRPDIAEILEQVQERHSYVNKVGVLSCGPKTLTKSVESACAKVNNKRKSPLFLHQFENFS